MPASRPSLVRVLAVVGTLGTPVTLIGAMLVSAGLLDLQGGLIGLGGILLSLAVLVRRNVIAAEALRRYADQLITGPEEAPPDAVRYGGSLVRELGSAILRLRRAGHDQIDELSRTLKAREIVLDTMADPILTLDDDGRILHANTAALRLFGMSVAGRPLTGVMRNPNVLAAVQAVLGGERARTVELHLSDPVERDFSVAVQKLPALSPDGTCVILAFHDVTALLVAEQLRRDFVANVSHELRTPLATLIGFIETLRGPARDDEEARDRFLAIMQDQSARMSRLVSDLLSLSRIELNEHLPPTASIDLKDLLERTAAALEVQAARRGIKIEVKLGGKLPPVLGDQDELAQVFQNLVDNAIKYGRADQPVVILADRAAQLPASLPKATHGAVSVAVIDQGEGIERQHLPRLTERFYRVDAARSKAIGGTGLGLAIVKHVINRHRGALIIESEPGKGSTFTVYLPMAKPQ
jgi:two-component system phosphate regulon sensor histidine kinase PhoR